MSIISGVRGLSLLILILFASDGFLYCGFNLQGHYGLYCLHLQNHLTATLALKMETKHQKQRVYVNAWRKFRSDFPTRKQGINFISILSSRIFSEVQPNNMLIHVRQTSVLQIFFLSGGGAH